MKPVRRLLAPHEAILRASSIAARFRALRRVSASVTLSLQAISPRWGSSLLSSPPLSSFPVSFLPRAVRSGGSWLREAGDRGE